MEMKYAWLITTLGILTGCLGSPESLGDTHEDGEPSTAAPSSTGRVAQAGGSCPNHRVVITRYQEQVSEFKAAGTPSAYVEWSLRPRVVIRASVGPSWAGDDTNYSSRETVTPSRTEYEQISWIDTLGIPRCGEGSRAISTRSRLDVTEMSAQAFWRNTQAAITDGGGLSNQGAWSVNFGGSGASLVGSLNTGGWRDGLDTNRFNLFRPALFATNGSRLFPADTLMEIPMGGDYSQEYPRGDYQMAVRSASVPTMRFPGRDGLYVTGRPCVNLDIRYWQVQPVPADPVTALRDVDPRNDPLAWAVFETTCLTESPRAQVLGASSAEAAREFTRGIAATGPRNAWDHPDTGFTSRRPGITCTNGCCRCVIGASRPRIESVISPTGTLGGTFNGTFWP